MVEKNLTELGNYIEGLVNEKCGGSFASAAKLLEISPGELSALKNGNRQTPNPTIIRTIAERLGGNYMLMFALAGYGPPGNHGAGCAPVQVMEAVGGELVTRDMYVVPRHWVTDGAPYFVFREYGPNFNGYSMCRRSAEWKDGDYVVVKMDGEISSRYIFRHNDGVELLSTRARQVREIVPECEILGIIERLVMEFEKSIKR